LYCLKENPTDGEKIIFNTIINDEEDTDTLLEKPLVELTAKEKKASMAFFRQ